MAKILCSITEIVGEQETGNTYAFPATDIMMSDKTTTVEDAINAKPGEVVTTGNKVGEIFNDYSTNIASGQCSHAEGIQTTAYGNGAHAEGFHSTASAPYSHAEGQNTTASGQESHAEGGNTTASGYWSHAEGSITTASGYTSHAEGQRTIASGDYSHAEGYDTKATGEFSHAEGYGTLASSNCQHVQGQYNVEDTAGLYAHIVGWGTRDDRKNIHTIDTSGNAVFSGKVTVQNTTPTASGDLTTKSYVDSKITDTKVTNSLNTTTKAYLTGTTSATTNTGTQIFDTGVYLDTVAGRLGVGSLSIGGAVVTYDSSSQTISI